MTSEDGAGPTQHVWSSEALLAKAQRYVDEMQSTSRDDWKYVLWSTYALEMLARAAVSHVSPSLLADHCEWRHVYYALGFHPTLARYTPRSVKTSTVIEIVGEIHPAFDSDLRGFCKLHMERRNEEIHSGSTSLDVLGSSKWLPRFYESCDVLLRFVGSDLETLFGSTEAKTARALIAAAKDESAKAVQKLIKASAATWVALPKDERAVLNGQAEVWAARHLGHRMECPSCSSPALVYGDAMAPPHQTIVDDVITETQQYLPSRFECVACQLKIGGLSELIAAGLGDTFTATSTYDAADLYRADDEYSAYEPDFNE